MFEFLDIDWWSLALPFGYISVLVGMLYTFSTIYRKRKAGTCHFSFLQCCVEAGPYTNSNQTAAQLANLEPWFGPHLQRQIYSTLLEISASDEKTKVPESVVRAALLRRAVADIGRIIQIRQAKQALNVLLQRGSVGDDLNQRFQRAEKEIEEELREVVMEVSPTTKCVRPVMTAIKKSLLIIVAGQRPCTRLGHYYIPICQRNGRKHCATRETRRDPGAN
jgi:translocation protein SEC66